MCNPKPGQLCRLSQAGRQAGTLPTMGHVFFSSFLFLGWGWMQLLLQGVGIFILFFFSSFFEIRMQYGINF